MNHVCMQHYIAGPMSGSRSSPRPRPRPRGIDGECTASEEAIGSYSSQGPLGATRRSLGRSDTLICFLLGGRIGSYTEHPWEIRHVHLASSRERRALSSSHYSSLPPCSEMILQEVTLDGKQSM